MVWQKNQKWWQVFLYTLLFLLAIRLGNGDLVKAYHESWSSLFHWIYIAILVSASMTLIQGLWILVKNRRENVKQLKGQTELEDI